MKIRTINIILIILISLLAAILSTLYVLYFLVWPMPGILDLVPDKPLVYLNISNLDETLSAAQESKFVNQFAKSSLWAGIKSSQLWLKLSAQASIWEAQIGLEREKIMQLVENNAILALYGNQASNKPEMSFLLISEEEMITRLIIATGRIESNIKSRYELTREKYKGISLITVKDPAWIYSYAFTGRAGILSNDPSIIKKAIDIYRGEGQSITSGTDFNELSSVLPASNVSFYVNSSNIRDSYQTLQPYFLQLGSGANILTPLINQVDALAGVVTSKNGNLFLDNSVIYRSKSIGDSDRLGESLSNSLPVPDNCLIFTVHETMEPESIFSFLEKYVSPKLAFVRNELLTILRNGMALAVIEPDINKSQLFPPLLIVLRVRDKMIAEKILNNLSISLKNEFGLEFSETVYGNTKINYAGSIPRIILPVGIGYTFIKEDLLAISSDLSALKSVIDLSFGKGQSFIKNNRYTNILAPISGNSHERIYMKIGSIAAITEQMAKLYALQARFTGNYKSERIARAISENVFVLKVWNNLGAAFGSDGNKTNVKIILNTTGS